MTSGTASLTWDSYDWTPNSSITDYTSISSTLQTTLSGALSTAGLNAFEDTTKVGVAAPITSSTPLSCDTTKWATTDACESLTKWRFSTGTDYTSSTSKGTKRAWLWLADADPTDKTAVFGVEKDNILELTLH